MYFPPHSLPKNFTNSTISFGQVIVGKTANKIFTIKNNSHKTLTYLITRSTQTSPIYYVFDINKYESQVEPGEELTLKITYSPNIPGSKNIDYFKIIDTEENLHRLCITGECIGPHIYCSERYLNFFPFSLKRTKKVFQLTNRSSVSTLFQFDCVEDERGVFQVNPVKGTLKPKEHIFITATFDPQVPRIYSKQLWCLVLNSVNYDIDFNLTIHYDVTFLQEPILLNLLGISCEETKTNSDNQYFKYYPFPRDETEGLKGYFSDSITVKSVPPPPVSLSINYFDFGKIIPKSDCQTLTTSFTNHMEQEVQVEWEKDDVFRMYPEKLTIPSGKSALYECRFNPQVADKLSSTIVNGHVIWSLNDADRTINVPLSISLRAIGHSFPKTIPWLPHVTITPSTVILPLTLPNFPSWATFKIQSHGLLPTLFKLLPPKKTNFIMKPMVGLVRSFQIVAVQLEAKCSLASENNSYVEKWNIELNGQVDKLLPIYVKAQRGVPFVVFGNENVVRFDPLQPGTQSYTYIPIINTSPCHLQFQCKIPENFGIDPVKGDLAPGEEMFGICWYMAKLTDEGQQTLKVPSELHFNYSNKVIGPPYEISIKVEARCVYSELCAMPTNYQCEDVEWGTTVKTNFYLYNFGKSNINFKLLHDHDLKDVILYPECSNCGPRERIMITVTLIVKRLGRHSLTISYQNRVNQFVETLTNECPKNIFQLEYNCMHPTIQIEDLVEHNYGYLFTKMELWELFKIDEINAAFREVVCGEEKRIRCYVPDGEVSHKPFYLVFLIRNISAIDTKLALKRRQMCDCKQHVATTSFTFRQKVFYCPHRELFTMEISDSCMTAKSSQKLTLTIKHLVEYKNILAYVIELNHDRYVVYEVVVNSIPKDEPILFTFDKNYIFNMGYIYIGLRESPVMAYWLYNNTEDTVFYQLDETEIIKLCNCDRFTVLKCLNPEGFVRPRSSRPLLFKFSPIEVKKYMITAVLKLGSITKNLHIIGYGINEIKKCQFSNIFPIHDKTTKNGRIMLSVDKIINEPILVHSSTERLFFIKNLSTTRQIKYSWKPCFVDGLVKIVPVNSEGLLQPRESQTVIIKTISLHEPCSIKLRLCCEFFNYTEWLKYNQMKKKTYGEKNTEEKSPPQILHISLPITVNIIGILDRDACISVEDQMKQKPFDGVHIDIDKFLKHYKEKTKIKESPIHPTLEETETGKRIPEDVIIDKDITQYVLECAVGDAVFSNYFLETLKNLKHEPSPFYSQFAFDPRDKDTQHKETVKIIATPQLPEVTDICQEALLDGIHTTFHLGPVKKSQMK